jgi:dTDP-4-dehydrorhamnose 3,5-epimerase-like enzyme
MNIDLYSSFIDERGFLLPIEFDLIPFIVKRIFVIKNVPINTIRGNHAHYKTKQYLLCLQGKIEVIINNGLYETKTLLNNNEGLLIDEMLWDAQKFLTENTILLVLCSTKYDENDYIFNFNEFKEIKNYNKIID